MAEGQHEDTYVVPPDAAAYELPVYNARLHAGDVTSSITTGTKATNEYTRQIASSQRATSTHNPDCLLPQHHPVATFSSSKQFVDTPLLAPISSHSSSVTHLGNRFSSLFREPLTYDADDDYDDYEDYDFLLDHDADLYYTHPSRAVQHCCVDLVLPLMLIILCIVMIMALLVFMVYAITRGI